jgi:fatty-acyl-CoA synthase
MDGVFRAAATSSCGLTHGDPETPIRRTWPEIHQQAKRIAATLTSRYAVGPGDSVPILAGDPGALAPAIQAVWLCGAAVTLLQQPAPRTDLGVWLDDTLRAVRLVGSSRVIVGEPFYAIADELCSRGLEMAAIDDPCGGIPDTFEPRATAERDIAARQLTSGATGTPKAIEISFGNLWSAVETLRHGGDLDADRDISVDWLPASHDMGFVGFFATPMYGGGEAVKFRPDQFLQNPSLWPQLITKYHATVTAGPNFSYSILSRVLERSEPGAFDLSTLRLALNGGEPINAADLRRFVAAGAKFGLQREAMTPAYGMAEATLAVSFSPWSKYAQVDRVQMSSLTSDGIATPASPRHNTDDVVEIVSVGSGLAGLDIRVTNAVGICGSRQVGRIEVRGKVIARSYLSEHGRQPLTSADGWLDTGDLGYLDDAERLHICGRSKDVIIIGGRNLYPDDIERAASTVTGVRTGCVAAVSIPAGADREGFAVLAESKLIGDDVDRIRSEIVAAVTRQVGCAPREVVVLSPGALPKTPSGKLRRGAAATLVTPRSADG